MIKLLKKRNTAYLELFSLLLAQNNPVDDHKNYYTSIAKVTEHVLLVRTFINMKVLLDNSVPTTLSYSIIYHLNHSPYL